jgi:hypothetical protein
LDRRFIANSFSVTDEHEEQVGAGKARKSRCSYTKHAGQVP